MSMKVFISSLLLLAVFSVSAQTYCLTITVAPSQPNPSEVAFNYTITASVSIDATIEVFGLTNVAGTTLLPLSGIPQPFTSASGTFSFSKTGGGTPTLNISDAAPDYGVTNSSTSVRLTADPNPPCAALPVALSQFSARAEGEKSLLKWSVSAELNTNHYEVERSADGINFEKIGRVAAKGTRGNALTVYGFTDETPLGGINYYRLNMVDRDGKAEYSSVEKVVFKRDVSIQAIPNPTQGPLTVVLNATTESTYYLRITDAQGRLMKAQQVEVSKGRNTMEMDMSVFPAGMYWLMVEGGSVKEYLKFVKE
jgi:hypothetical protein